MEIFKMTEYIVEQTKESEYCIFRLQGKDEILEKIFTDLTGVEVYITLKNGYIKEFKKLQKINERA
jgi:hypothetical protein